MLIIRTHTHYSIDRTLTSRHLSLNLKYFTYLRLKGVNIIIKFFLKEIIITGIILKKEKRYKYIIY